eukprot:gene10443-11536_t
MDLFQDYLLQITCLRFLKITDRKSKATEVQLHVITQMLLVKEMKKENLDEKFEEIKPSPSAILQWITGSPYKPLDGAEVNICVLFDHECMDRNPNHKICFPVVSACAKEITLPIAHFKTSEEFNSLFSLAVSRAKSFESP